jgi:hypothetical protein
MENEAVLKQVFSSSIYFAMGWKEKVAILLYISCNSTHFAMGLRNIFCRFKASFLLFYTFRHGAERNC